MSKFVKKQLIITLASLLFLFGCSQNDMPTPVPTEDMFEYSPAPTPPDTLPELIEVLSGYSAEARMGAAYKLGGMGTEAAPAIPALTMNLYYDGPYEVRQAAAWALGEIGPSARSAVPALIPVAIADFAHASAAAAEALGKIGDDSAVPALIIALDHEYDGTGINAAESIAMLTGQDFPDAGGPGYTLDTDGVALIIKAAKGWWHESGQFEIWQLKN